VRLRHSPPCPGLRCLCCTRTRVSYSIVLDIWVYRIFCLNTSSAGAGAVLLFSQFRQLRGLWCCAVHTINLDRHTRERALSSLSLCTSLLSSSLDTLLCITSTGTGTRVPVLTGKENSRIARRFKIRVAGTLRKVLLLLLELLLSPLFSNSLSSADCQPAPARLVVDPCVALGRSS